jgi:ABC-type multidrug transport system ATPase subunit
MIPVVITAVAGPPGAGKTTWIRQQLERAPTTGLYFCLNNNMPIDRTHIATEFPQVQILAAED